MNRKKIFYILFFGMYCSNLFSQLKLNLNYGYNYDYHKVIQNSKYIEKVNFNTYDFKKISLEYAFKKSILEATIFSTHIGLNPRIIDPVTGFKLANNPFLASQKLYQLNYQFNLVDIKAIKLPARGVDTTVQFQKRYLLNFKLLPVIGIAWVKVPEIRQGLSYDTSLAIYKSDLNLAKNWEENIYNGGDFRACKNGFSVCVGVKIKSYRKGKEFISFNINYTQGFTTLMQSKYNINLKQKDSSVLKQSANFYSKGSFLAIYASYPLTILNKKGFRRKDRLDTWYKN
jgi:hypothetical protein